MIGFCSAAMYEDVKVRKNIKCAEGRHDGTEAGKIFMLKTCCVFFELCNVV